MYRVSRKKIHIVVYFFHSFLSPSLSTPPTPFSLSLPQTHPPFPPSLFITSSLPSPSRSPLQFSLSLHYPPPVPILLLLFPPPSSSLPPFPFFFPFPPCPPSRSPHPPSLVTSLFAPSHFKKSFKCHHPIIWPSVVRVPPWFFFCLSLLSRSRYAEWFVHVAVRH